MALVVVGLTVLGIVLTARTGQPEWLFVGLPFTLVLFVVARFAPTGYRFSKDGLHVERRIGDVIIPYARIRSVDAHPRPAPIVALFASAGLFGRFGWFWNRTLGVHHLYLTRRDGVVWITTDRGWIALSPDRPDEFVERLGARLRLLR